LDLLVVTLPLHQSGNSTSFYAGNQTWFLHPLDLNPMQVQETKHWLHVTRLLGASQPNNHPLHALSLAKGGLAG